MAVGLAKVRAIHPLCWPEWFLDSVGAQRWLVVGLTADLGAPNWLGTIGNPISCLLLFLIQAKTCCQRGKSALKLLMLPLLLPRWG